MYEFIFAENQTFFGRAPVIFSFDVEALSERYDWSTKIKLRQDAPQAAIALAEELCRTFGRRVAVRQQSISSHETPWTLTTAPEKPSRIKLRKDQLDPTASDEIYELKLALDAQTPFADVPVTGKVDIGAYKRYGYSDGPAPGFTMMTMAVALSELFERSIAYRPAETNDDWRVFHEPDYFTPFDDETTGKLTPAPGPRGLYKLYILSADEEG